MPHRCAMRKMQPIVTDVPWSVRLSVRSSVCLSQVGVLSKRLNESGWFLARELPYTLPPVLHCVIRKFRYLQKYWYFRLELCTKLSTTRHSISIVETY